MDYTVIFAIGAGFLLGAIGAFALSNSLATRLAKVSTRPRIVKISSGVGATVLLIPAFFLAFVAGGNLGGSWGEYLFGATGIPVGLAVGIAAVLSVVVTAGALAGAILGKGLANAFLR